MKKNFFTGLAILVPIAITFAIVEFIFNLLTTPLFEPIQMLFHSNPHLQDYFLFRDGDLSILVSRILALILLFIIIISAGIIGRNFLVNYVFTFADSIVRRIPIISRIYQSLKDAVNTLFKPKNSNYSKVVLAPYPSQDSYSIGFVTKEKPTDADPSHLNQVTVFIPGTPNPTAGFLLSFKHEELIPVDMKVDEAFKFLLSCGVVEPNFNIDLSTEKSQ
jgi:uncharacterized membrane protein